MLYKLWYNELPRANNEKEKWQLRLFWQYWNVLNFQCRQAIDEAKLHFQVQIMLFVRLGENFCNSFTFVKELQ